MRANGNRDADSVPDASHSSAPARTMRPPLIRVFHLMVLVAAVAVTLVAAPAVMKAIIEADPVSSWTGKMYVISLITTMFTVWTPFLVPVTLLGSGRPLTVACRSYGTSAVLAAAIALAFAFAAKAAELLAGGLSGVSGPPDWTSILLALRGMQYDLPKLVASAIVATWLILGLSGAGRKPSQGFEILGLCFGAIWTGWSVLGPILYLLPIPWIESWPLPL